MGVLSHLRPQAVNRPTPALEKVRQDVSEARGHARNHREQPCSISFNEVRLMLDALNWTGDHWWSFSFSPQDFVCEIASRQFAIAHFYVTIVLVACFVCTSLLSGQLIVFLLVHLIILVPFASKGSLEDAILVRVKLLVRAFRGANLDADRSGLGFVSVHSFFIIEEQNLIRKRKVNDERPILVLFCVRTDGATTSFEDKRPILHCHDIKRAV